MQTARKYFLVFILSCFSLVYSQNSLISNQYGEHVREFLKTGHKVPKFESDVTELLANSNPSIKNPQLCELCVSTVDEFIKARHEGMLQEAFKNKMKELCVLYHNWHPTVCNGFVDIEIDTLLFIIDNKQNLTGERVCNIFLQAYECEDSQRSDWGINLSTETRLEVKKIKSEQNIENVLHITDFHFDPIYKPGSNAKCKYNLCCQEDSGIPEKPEDAAGYWGDYHVCDSPWHSVLNVLDHIKSNHRNLSRVYFTGDIISHRSWTTSIEKNLESIRRLYGELYKTFGDVKVFPILGNHEPHPMDFYYDDRNGTSKSLSTQWLFDAVSEEWSRWLPKSALETVKIGGFYTLLLKPGFRLIALNSNVCYIRNLWLIYEDKDPYGQLQWFADILERAEKDNEVVHILSHVPPGDKECYVNWNKVFVKIVNRFAHIIKGQFNGHTHYDEFRVFYKENSTEIINVAYNGGSFTTYKTLNPNYRVYDVNLGNYEVENFDQWIFNLTEANLSPSIPPRWYKLYSFKEAYGLNSLQFNDIADLLERMSTDITLLEQYYRFEVRDSDIAIANTCDETCLKAKLCAIKSVHVKDMILCRDRWP